MKNIIKKWWFWLIIIVVIILSILIYNYIENKKVENKFKAIGESASNFYKQTKEADGYLDKFEYNYSTGNFDYIK